MIEQEYRNIELCEGIFVLLTIKSAESRRLGVNDLCNNCSLQVKNQIKIPETTCKEYQCLSAKITNIGRCEEPWAPWIQNSELKKLKRKDLVYETIVKSILLYGAEVWKISEQQKKRVLTLGKDFWRRSTRVLRLDGVRNVIVRDLMRVQIQLLNKFNKISWNSMATNSECRIPEQVMMWIPKDNRNRGKPKVSW